jgi:hypothetical protein
MLLPDQSMSCVLRFFPAIMFYLISKILQLFAEIVIPAGIAGIQATGM